MCKTQQTKCLSSMRTQTEKKMVCDNHNNQSCNSECSNENDRKWRMNVKPLIYRKILGYPRIMGNDKILLTKF